MAKMVSCGLPSCGFRHDEVEDAFDIGLIVLHGTLTYVGFPLAYDGMRSLMLAVHLANLALLFILMLRSASRMDWKLANPTVYSQS